MCQSCDKTAIAKGLCKNCYNKQFWATASPEQLQKRRDSVKNNYKMKKLSCFSRTYQLNPTPLQTRQRIKKYVNNRKRETRKITNTIKTDRGCIDCGFNKVAIALDFDHVRGQKNFNISRAADHGCSLDKILAEIELCEVRCANCHRIVTQIRQET